MDWLSQEEHELQRPNPERLSGSFSQRSLIPGAALLNSKVAGQENSSQSRLPTRVDQVDQVARRRMVTLDGVSRLW